MEGLSLDDLKISTQLRKVLEDSRFSTTSARKQAKASTSKLISTPLSFLVAAAKHITSNPGSSTAIFDIQDRVWSRISVDQMVSQYNKDTDQQFLMNEALQDARQIREQTGGKDEYLGLRHVLFSTLLPAEPIHFRATFEAITAAGADGSKLAQAIADFCQRDLEKGEDADVWAKIVSERPSFDSKFWSSFQQPNPVATYHADDPWSDHAVDRSGARLEASAFASMICWEKFRPPLAVGVFGDWGSGKSFFMRLVHDAIEKLSPSSEIEPKQSDHRTNDKDFLNHIVQIRFNAWHYAESNLWASLVDHILTELDKWISKKNQESKSEDIFQRLDTARESTLQSAKNLALSRSRLEAAKQDLSDAQEVLAKARQDQMENKKTWTDAAWSSVLKDPTLKSEIVDAAADLGLNANVTDNVEDLRQAVELYRADGGSQATLGMWQLANRHPCWIAGLVVGVLAFPPLLIWLLGFVSESTQGAGVAGVLSPIAIYAAFAARHLRSAHAKLTKVQNLVSLEIDRKTEEEAERAKAAARLVDKAEAEEIAAAERLRVSKESVAQLNDEFQARDGKAQLLDFVRQRVSSGDYRSQLSFVAQIRRDFEELNRLMSLSRKDDDAQGRLEKHNREIEALLSDQVLGPHLKDEAEDLRATAKPIPKGSTVVFERIVLYIDDLDRCPAEQVVAVLQAIHLLLAYPLFVVFVAVDVRWLREALEKEYPQFADDNQKPDEFDQATPGDYLEKIFQIPYWVRPMNEEATKALLADHIGTTIAGQGSEPQNTDTSIGDEVPISRTDQPKKDKVGEEGASDGNALRATELAISEDEKNFMEELAAGLDGSPRRTLRYVNSYRILKAGMSQQSRSEVEQGAYKEVLFLLALQIAQPDVFLSIYKASGKGSPNPTIDAPTGLNISEQGRSLKTAFERNGREWSELQKWVDVVARFGFKGTVHQQTSMEVLSAK